ncbi:MAG: hypothetical protein Q4G58_02520 [bacterium]|nr:hypothetical protein [bacterium]
MPKLTISFRNNTEDMALYNEIKTHSDCSAYVKRLLKKAISKDNEESLPTKEEHGKQAKEQPSEQASEKKEHVVVENKVLAPYIKRRYTFTKKRTWC